MDINNLTIGQVKELAAMFGSQYSQAKSSAALGSHMIGKAVIIRTYSAGVHFGTLVARDGAEALLTNARRIWYWDKAFTLSKVAVDGVGSGSKISVAVPEILLTEAIEVIPVSDAAAKQISAAKVHKPE